MKKHFRWVVLAAAVLSLLLVFTACGTGGIPDGTYVPEETAVREYLAEEYSGQELEEMIEQYIEGATVRIERGKFIYLMAEYSYILNSDGRVTFPNDEIADDTFTYKDGKLVMSYEGLVVEMIRG